MSGCIDSQGCKGRHRAFFPDVAVLDFNLGSETSEEVADDLIEQRVPFVFATGYGDNVMIPERFRHIPIVRKPVNRSALAIKVQLARLGLYR